MSTTQPGSPTGSSERATTTFHAAKTAFAAALLLALGVEIARVIVTRGTWADFMFLLRYEGSRSPVEQGRYLQIWSEFTEFNALFLTPIACLFCELVFGLMAPAGLQKRGLAAWTVGLLGALLAARLVFLWAANLHFLRSGLYGSEVGDVWAKAQVVAWAAWIAIGVVGTSAGRIWIRTPEERVWIIRQSTNAAMLFLCGAAAVLGVLVLGIVLFFLLSRGIHALNWNFFTRLPNHMNEQAGGMAQSIVGTLVLLGLASSIGLPLGILGGIYQVEARGRFASVVRFFTDVLNGIPSIVIGIFVYAIAVAPVGNPHPNGFSAFAGGLALGIMMIPTVMRTTEEILKLVPFSMREASLGLGATRWRTMWSVVLPVARGGIITGVMLALARIAGETAPLIFTILGNEWVATHVVHLGGAALKVPTMNAPIDALPLRIYNYASGVNAYQQQLAWAGAVVLIGMILVFSVAARFATRSKMLEEK